MSDRNDTNPQHVDSVEGSIINVDRQDNKQTGGVWASAEPMFLRQKIIWFLAFLYILFSIWIAYLLVWDRGLYLDDYYFKSEAQDLATATWKPLFEAPIPNVRILAQIVYSNLASAIPSHEFYVRLLWAMVHGLSVMLLGIISYRVTSSKVFGFITSISYIAPFPAHEALLWHTQGVHMLSTSLFLLTTYLFILVIEKRKHWPVYLTLGVFFIALALQFSELPVMAIVIFVFLAFATSLRPGEWGYWWKRVQTASFLAFVGAFVCLLHYVIFTGRSIAVERRGGLVLDPTAIFEKYVQFLRTIYWFILDPDWGLRLTYDSFVLGVNIIIESRVGLALLVFSVLCCALWLLRVNLPRDNVSSLKLPSFMVFLGVLWIFVSFVPGTVIRWQIMEWRMLYYTLAGLSVAIGGITWGWLVLFQNMPSWVLRAFLAIPLSISVLATITMLGYAEVYRLRSQLDQQQIAELVSVVTPQSLEPDTTFIPINPSIKITKHNPSDITVHDKLLFGVFEVPYAARPALRMAYRRPDIDVVVTHHWTTPMAFGLVESPEGMVLKVNDRLVSLNKALPFTFTYRNGSAVLLSPLIVVAPDGTVVDSIDIPLVEMYRAKGTPVESIRVPAIP